MSNIFGSNTSKGKVYKNQNSVETLKNSRGSGIFDKFFGDYSKDSQAGGEFDWSTQERKPVRQQRREFSLFNYQQYYEREVVRKEIRQLTEQIKKEFEFIKKADASLIQEVKDVQKLTLESLPEKPGIYHIRFFEIVLSILRSLRAKIGESRTWLQAMISKKKKRGSLFMVRSKKKGTLYSLSQELQSARSIQ